MGDERLPPALEEAMPQPHVPLGPTAPAYVFRHALLGEAGPMNSSPRSGAASMARTPSSRGTSYTRGSGRRESLSALAIHATAAGEVALALRASIAAARASRCDVGLFEAARAYERALACGRRRRQSTARPTRTMSSSCSRPRARPDGDGAGRAREAARAAVAGVDPTASRCGPLGSKSGWPGRSTSPEIWRGHRSLMQASRNVATAATVDRGGGLPREPGYVHALRGLVP